MHVKLDATFRQRFGQRLRRLREQRGLTQEQLSAELPCEPRLISRYERGVGLPSATMLVILASTFGVSIGKILLGQQIFERRLALEQRLRRCV